MHRLPGHVQSVQDQAPPDIEVASFLDPKRLAVRHGFGANDLPERVRRMSLLFAGSSPWPTSDTLEDTAVLTAYLSAAASKSVVEDRRLVAAFWSLMASPGFETAGAPLECQARRRNERSGLTVPPDGVRVVRLHLHARPQHPDGADGTQQVEWSHRWLVSGHWRRQWYPASRQHQAKYILPYVKGPADRPLVVRDTVRTVKP